MKEILKQYAAYNVWANQKLLDTILALPAELQVAHVTSSFNGIYKTLSHLWDVESIWWQRLKLAENIIIPTNDTMSIHDIASGLIKQSKLWDDWVNKSTDAAIEHVFFYQNTKKELFKQPVYQVLLHLFNHQTYHRGQLVTILRQLKVENIPATDFIVFSRKKK